MKQYDIYENPFAGSRSFAPLVVVLSSHLLDVGTAVVAPLMRDAQLAVSQLHVRVEHEGRSWVVAVHDLAAVDRGLLRRRLGDASAHADELERAVDRLFTGF